MTPPLSHLKIILELELCWLPIPPTPESPSNIRISVIKYRFAIVFIVYNATQVCFK